MLLLWEIICYAAAVIGTETIMNSFYRQWLRTAELNKHGLNFCCVSYGVSGPRDSKIVQLESLPTRGVNDVVNNYSNVQLEAQ